jgi:hypothetical protein
MLKWTKMKSKRAIRAVFEKVANCFFILDVYAYIALTLTPISVPSSPFTLSKSLAPPINPPHHPYTTNTNETHKTRKIKLASLYFRSVAHPCSTSLVHRRIFLAFPPLQPPKPPPTFIFLASGR